MSAALACRWAALALMCAPSPGWAHGMEGGGLTSGLIHPIGGADHLLAMVGVGIVSAKLGGRSLWQVPLAFMASMTLGFWLGISYPATTELAGELGILASVVVLGALVALPVRQTYGLAWLAVLFFGLCHGRAHGIELPDVASPWAFSAGFLVASAGFHAMGAIVGRLCQHHRRPRRNFAMIGATLGAAGLAIAATASL